MNFCKKNPHHNRIPLKFIQVISVAREIHQPGFVVSGWMVPILSCTQKNFVNQYHSHGLQSRSLKCHPVDFPRLKTFLSRISKDKLKLSPREAKVVAAAADTDADAKTNWKHKSTPDQGDLIMPMLMTVVIIRMGMIKVILMMMMMMKLMVMRMRMMIMRGRRRRRRKRRCIIMTCPVLGDTNATITHMPWLCFKWSVWLGNKYLGKLFYNKGTRLSYLKLDILGIVELRATQALLSALFMITLLPPESEIPCTPQATLCDVRIPQASLKVRLILMSCNIV